MEGRGSRWIKGSMWGMYTKSTGYLSGVNDDVGRRDRVSDCVSTVSDCRRVTCLFIRLCVKDEGRRRNESCGRRQKRRESTGRTERF